MSSHQITAMEPARYSVVVGWDPPLATFFAQVQDLRVIETTDPEKEDIDPFVLWIGADMAEVETVEELCEGIAGYAEIPMDLQLRLAAERIANTGYPKEEERRSSLALRDAEAAEPDVEKRLALLQAMSPAERRRSPFELIDPNAFKA